MITWPSFFHHLRFYSNYHSSVLFLSVLFIENDASDAAHVERAELKRANPRQRETSGQLPSWTRDM